MRSALKDRAALSNFNKGGWLSARPERPRAGEGVLEAPFPPARGSGGAL